MNHEIEKQERILADLQGMNVFEYDDDLPRNESTRGSRLIEFVVGYEFPNEHRSQATSDTKSAIREEIEALLPEVVERAIKKAEADRLEAARREVESLRRHYPEAFEPSPDTSEAAE